MALFGKSDVSSLQRRVSELELSLDTSVDRAMRLEEENKEYKQTISNFHLTTSKYDQQIETLQKQHKAELDALNKKLIETEKSVNKKLNQELQRMGVQNFLLEIPLEVKSSRDAYNQFMSMPNGSQKTEYFNQNEKLIREGMSIS